MKRSVELPSELAVQTCRALIACVDELTARHVVEYGHLDGTQNAAVLRKMAQDDQVRQAALPVLNEFFDFLTSSGLAIIPDESARTGVASD